MVNLDSTLSRKDVWRALALWISKPSAYNKSVGTTELLCANCNESPSPLDTINSFFGGSSLEAASSYAFVKSSLSSLFSNQGIKVTDDLEWEQCQGSWLVTRFIIPKNGVFRLSSIDLVICDFDNGLVDFMLLINDGTWKFVTHYLITYNGDNINLMPKCNESVEIARISNLFFSKFEKWTQSSSEGSGCQSLCLVSHEEYYVLYNELKRKYCDSIRKIWRESTDPDKFIHEDIAIATYLILLWGRKVKSFVDLGCGNGLLVHILNSEGHRGLGIDVRSRKIWKSYPPTTVLKEQTIVPSPSYVFPDTDWIIGNHSDELSPWVPVIALLSSKTANFFLLPCCSYEFSGVKYQRSNTSKSQYMDYLDFLENLSVECGFTVAKDRLKIPSTKRICLVSQGRRLLNGSLVDVVKDIINRRSNSVVNQTNQQEWVHDFKARNVTEKVRNCTQLDKPFVASLLSIVANQILSDVSDKSAEWNAGQSLDISTIAKRLPKECLNQLKKECGGLQTFFRNNHFIFRVSEGKVTFRKPEVSAERRKVWKAKPCWFYVNHPQRCPLSDADCSYIHSETDLHPS